MSSRVGPQTVKTAIQHAPGGVAGLIQSSHWTTATLLNATVGGKPVIKDALDALPDKEFIHASVAAIYCQCSESTFERHRRGFGTQSELKSSGDAKMLPSTGGPQTRHERHYTKGFVKKVLEVIRAAPDEGDDARAKKLIQQHTTKGRLASKLQKKIAWLVDENGHIYTEVTFKCVDGKEMLGKLFKNGARVQILTFQQAMTERTWVDPIQRAPFHDYYLSLLDAERQLLVTQGEITSSKALESRLEQIVPKTSRPGKPPGMRDR